MRSIMLFLLGGWILWTGIKMIRSRSNPRRQMDQQILWMRQRELSQMQERLEILKNQREAMKLAILETQARITAQNHTVDNKPLDELSQRVLMDAMARENRAKAALLNILRGDGVDQDRIDAVMRMIDEPELTRED